jgi:2'-5' RNA ligase
MSGNQSVLLIPALHVTASVDEYRQRYDPSAAAGMPPHITIMYPFLAANELGGETMARLVELLGMTGTFEYSLTDVRDFDQQVVYLAPDPGERFIQLTSLVSEHYKLRPYGGAYSEVIPHLTVALSAPVEERRRMTDKLRQRLPQAGIASEAWVMVGSNATTWRRTHSIALSARGAGS